MSKEYKIVLNKHSVTEIKLLLAEGKTSNNAIAEIYGVNACEISKIKTGSKWSSVQIEKVESIGVETTLSDCVNI